MNEIEREMREKKMSEWDDKGCIDGYLLVLRDQLLAFMIENKTTTVPLSGKMGLNHLTVRGFVKASKAPSVPTIRVIEEYLKKHS